jgi:hypothetical protein
MCNFGQNLHKLFLKLAIIGRTKNSKIMAIEPMNRKRVRPFRATKAQRSEQARETIQSSHVDFGQCARVANFRIVCVSKTVLSGID